MAKTQKKTITSQFDDEGEEFALELYDFDDIATDESLWHRPADLELYDPELGVTSIDNALEEARKDSFFKDLHNSQLDSDAEDAEDEDLSL